MVATGSVVAPAQKAASSSSHYRRSWAGWGFLAPFAVIFALVFLAPIAYSIYLSLYQDKLIGGNSFVGFDNYQQALTDPVFWDSVRRVGLFLVVQVPIMLFLALLAALAIDGGRLYGAALFRISIFLPYAVPAVVATLMWGFMYGKQFGLVGSINDTFGISLPDPLGPGLVLASIGNIVTWEFVGYNMLIFYAALRVIPVSLYEAAAIDGASEFRIIRAIKLPGHPRSAGDRHDLLDHRQLPALQRAQHPALRRQERHQHPVHAQHVRVLAVVLGPAVQLLGHDRDHHGRC